MEAYFIKVLNMSITASWLIAAILVLRLLLKKAPRWIHCLLWAFAAVRLVCPISIESACSLVPGGEPFDLHNIRYETPEIHTGVTMINSVVNPVLAEKFPTDPVASINPFHAVMGIAAGLWLLGMFLLIVYAAVGYLRVVWSVREAIVYQGNIRIGDQVKSPFVLGVFRPRIYLPSGMEPTAMEHVIAHEKAHLSRLDHVWKPLGFLILTVHWFNPLCWLAYVLLCRDIEMACDEKVVRALDLDQRKEYAYALLECSRQRRLVLVCPLAFGEVGVKERVKGVLSYRKPAFWLIAVAALICMAVAVCFLTDPRQARADARTSGNPGGASGAEGTVSGNLNGEPGREPNTQGTASGNPNGEPGGASGLQGTASGNSAGEPGGASGSRGTASGSLNGNPGAETNAASNAAANPEGAAEASRAQEQAIRAAIVEHNRPTDDPTGLLTCVNFVMLANEVATPLKGAGGATRCVCYGWALYEELIPSGLRLSCVSQRHRPVALTFDVDEKGAYTLVEYWEPGEGASYADEIRAKVPAAIADNMTDSQLFLLRQEQECYLQAAAACGMDEEFTAGAVECLLNLIVESPALSSDPQDYIDAHLAEYREMTCWGERALRYCFGRFEGGQETGLEGMIMMRACDEIMNAKGEGFLYDISIEVNGQLWYEMFKNNALRLKEQFSGAEIAARYPVSYVLLELLGEI